VTLRTLFEVLPEKIGIAAFSPAIVATAARKLLRPLGMPTTPATIKHAVTTAGTAFSVAVG